MSAERDRVETFGQLEDGLRQAALDLLDRALEDMLATRSREYGLAAVCSVISFSAVAMGLSFGSMSSDLSIVHRQSCIAIDH